jgi:DNA primase
LGLAVRVAVVPAPHDPDSFIKANGGEAFRRLITNAEGFFDYLLGRLCMQNDITTDKGRLTVLRSMAETVQKTGNRVLLDKYAQKTALRLGVMPESVRTEFGKTSANRATAGERFETDEEVAGDPAAKIPRPTGPELWLLKLVLRYESLMDWLVAHFDPNWISHPVVKDIIIRRLAAHTENSWQGLASFLDGFDSAETRSLITEVTLEGRELPNPEQQLADITLRMRNQTLDRQVAELMHRSSQPETTEEERTQLLREQQQLRQMKRQALSPLSPV